LQDELFRAFEADLHAVPHVHTVLDAITQPVCVASSGSPQRMRVTLGRTGLYDRFAPNIFSALQVQNGKPAPDLFLFAAGQMKTRPERCVAVDDKISISTVYRTVKLFEDAGIIERHDFREGRARYEQMPDSHHDHLINLRDGKVIEFTSEEIEKLQAEIARKLGYKLVDHRLELYCVPLDEDK